MSSRSSSRRPQIDVVFCGTFAAWHLGTIQARALPLAQELCRQGVRCAIVTTPWDLPSEVGVVDLIDGIELHNTPSSGHTISGVPQAILQQIRTVARLCPRAIHVFKPRGFAGFAGMALQRSIPVVVDSDDWEGDGGWNRIGSYPLLQRRIFDWQERTMLRQASAVTAASALLAHRAREIRASNTRPTSVPDDVLQLPNALPIQWYNTLASAPRTESSSVPTIVLYSRFAEFSPEWLPRFAAALDRSISAKVRVRLVGGSGGGAGLGRVFIDPMGYVSRNSLPSALVPGSIAIVPHDDSLVARSKHSVKLLELMASGSAIVASDVGDAAAIVGSSGVLLQSNDPVEMASATAALLAVPDVVMRLSEAARHRVHSTFLVSNTAPLLERWYRQLGLVA